jgi:hypothetical protein
MKFKQIASPGCLIQPGAQTCPRPASGFSTSENCVEREFIRVGRGAARKGDRHFDVNPEIDLQSSI